jgi:hypothetical protein
VQMAGHDRDVLHDPLRVAEHALIDPLHQITPAAGVAREQEGIVDVAVPVGAGVPVLAFHGKRLADGCEVESRHGSGGCVRLAVGAAPAIIIAGAPARPVMLPLKRRLDG